MFADIFRILAGIYIIDTCRLHRRTRRGGGGEGGNCPPKFWKTMEILANAKKNQENSGRFIRN
jgi:hypothetical protein